MTPLRPDLPCGHCHRHRLLADWSPPPSSGTSSTAPQPQNLTVASEQPPLRIPIRGRILHRFAHLVKPSCSGHRSGVWDLPHRLEGHGSGVGGGLEWRGVAPMCRAGEVDRGGGDEDGNQWTFPEEVMMHKREGGRGGLGLNPNAVTPLYPPPIA
jgi:hypothetical protein